MKRLGLTLVAAVCLTATTFAAGNQMCIRDRKRVACASSRRSWTPGEPRGMSITKYPTSASPACTHATTLLTGKAFRIWAAALQPCLLYTSRCV